MFRAVAFLCGLLLSAPALAQVIPPGFPPGAFQSRAPLDASGGGASFSGSADIVASPTVWAGLRAMSLATVSTKSANICNSGDANCADVNTLANGNFDVTTAQGAPLNCGGTGGTCTVKTLYDKSGTLQCGGSACDFTNATAASRPTLVFSCSGSLPCMAFSGSQSLTSPAITGFAQSFVISAVGERTGSTTSFSDIIGTLNNNDPQLGFSNATNTALQFSGTVATATANDNVIHAMNSVHNGASSILYIDGSSNSTSPGTDSLATSDKLQIGTGNNLLTGKVFEVGIWTGSFASGVSCGSQSACLSAMNSNQHTYWGF